jgi:zinc protease
MLAAALILLLQVQIVGPYTFREDQGQTTKVILKNGLTVIVREQQAIPLASVTTFVKAGYLDEEDRISGISHVIEHMFFKGTAKRPVGEIARQIRGVGGYLNAYTHYDRTVYHTEVPAESLKTALEIQADALWNSTFDADELKREIEVVLQENNRKLDNPSAVAAEKLYETAFQQHRMRRWRIGTPEGLRALTRDDLVAYVKKYYRPSNIILSISGKLDIEETLNDVVKFYGDMADPEEALERESAPAEPPQTSLRYTWQRGPIEQHRAAMGFHVPGVLSNDARPLEVLAAILSEGRASVLNQYVRDEKGLMTSGSAEFLRLRDLGYFQIELETGSPLEAQTAVLAELENIKKFGVTKEALARAKTLIAQNQYHSLETVQGIAHELAYYEALGDWKGSQNYLSSIQRVTGPDIVRVAAKYLTFENLSAFEYMPESVTRVLTEADYRTVVVDKVAEAMEQRSVQELPVVADIPAPTQSIAIDLVKPMEKRSILRGPDVYLLEDHRLPLVSFGIFYPGGRLNESPKNAGITELMLRTAVRGTQRFNSPDIARRLENAGARLHVVNETDFFGYIVDGISGKMEQALEVLMEVLQQPVFLDEEIEKEKVLQVARIKRLRENNYAYPVRVFLQALFGEHPYGRPAVGTEAGLQEIKRQDLQSWFKTNQRPLIPTIVIVGDTQGTGLVASLAETLTNEDLHERDIASMPSPSAGAASKESVETVVRQQTALVYGFPGVTRAGDDRYPLIVLKNIVSGLGGRFFDAIREKQGLAYAVKMENESFAKGGALFTYVGFSPENETRVKESLEKEFERLRKEGVTADEVRKAIAYSIGEYEIGLQTRLGLVLEYARSVYAGEGIPGVTGYSALLRRVTPDQVKKAAEAYLDPQKARITIVRGTKK